MGKQLLVKEDALVIDVGTGYSLWEDMLKNCETDMNSSSPEISTTALNPMTDVVYVGRRQLSVRYS